MDSTSGRGTAGMEQHLDPDTLAAYVDGRLALGELDSADRHIDACGSCRSELSALAAVSSLPIAAAARDVPEGRLGRYHLLRELGRGSMGIVVRAWDPELARPVAIKLLRDVGGATREQLRDEARALARLRHPNVVTVYDVLSDEAGMYVAMELVDGETLRGYCRQRSPHDILAACIRAGRGLAAAHDAGVIHRDFKPENVLVGLSGEVRVSDFGLARTDDAPDAERAICGTPAYMAPEILRREPATAASDQYSFCVTVHEMLTGARPTGDAVHPAVPAWVARALARGLSSDPAARWPSLHALVAALADDPRVRRRRRVMLGAVVAGALAVGGAATAGLALWLGGSAGPTCAVDGALAEAWGTERASAVSRAIAAAGGPDAATRVTAALDGYASTWLAARREACEATHVRGEQSALALDRRVACLDRGRRELGELTRVLAAADARLAGKAHEAIARLRDPRACTGADEGDALPGDAVGRVAVEHARTLLDRAAALQYAAKLDDADALAIQAGTLAAGSPRLVGEALLVRARVAIDRAQYDRAEDLLFDALHAAQRGRDDHLVAAIWVEIVMTTGAQKHRFDLALSNARAADAALARIEPGELQLRYEYTLGALLLAQGKLDAARGRLVHALALAGSEPHREGQVGLLRAALCDVERQAGKLAAAREHCTQALALLERAFGPDHVRVAVTLNVQGALAFAEHDLPTAERAYRRVIEILERRGQRDQLTYALALSNLGAVYSSRDEVAPARQYFERARAVFDAHHSQHPQRLFPLQGLASLALRTGDPDLAAASYERVRAAMAATYAPESPQLLIATYNLALAYRGQKQPEKAQAALDELIARALVKGREQWMLAARGLDLAAQLAGDRRDYRTALAFLDRALAAMERANQPVEHALLLRHLGEVHRRMKKPALAIDPLERALTTLAAQTEVDPYDLGSTRYHLALARWDSGRDRARAIALAKQAAGDLERAQTGEGLTQFRARLAAFLRTHRR